MAIRIKNKMLNQLSTKIKNYFKFTKPGISRAQILTVSIGYFLAKQSVTFETPFLLLVSGTYLFSAAACGLNNIIEEKYDSKMIRTKNRELPLKLLNLKEAWAIVGICFFTAFFLIQKINIETLIVALLTVVTYCFIYTPLKRVSWMNTLVGAVPGALPIIGGWVATNTPLHIAGISVFFTLFSWQIPHFYALSIMHLEDYKVAGFKMLPIDDNDYKSTKRQILIFTILMIISSIGPYLYGFLSELYLIGVSIISILFISLTFRFIRKFTKENAKKLFILSIIYLPLWLILVLIDVII